MVVPFSERLEDDTRAFEEISAYARANDFLFAIKKDLKASDE
jgi:hypothetical protein